MQFERYLRCAVLRAWLLITGGLTALFSLLVFVEQLALLGDDYGTADALAYTLLTAPGRVLQVAAVSTLLATLLALGRLARDGELTALRSFGISEGRIIVAVVKLCAPLTLVLFVAIEFVVPPAQLAAQRIQAADLVHHPAARKGGRLWVARGGEFLHVEDGTDGTHLRGVSLYSFHADGTLDRLVMARSADVAPDGQWTLRDVRIKTAVGDRITTSAVPLLDTRAVLTRSQIHLLALPVADMPPVELRVYVDELRRERLPALVYAQAFWSDVAIPVSLVAMTIIAAPFVFGLRRSGSAGRQIVVGAIVGIVFTLAGQIMGYLGLLLDLPAASSTLAPPLLLLALGGDLLLRLHGRSARSFLFDFAQERVLPLALRTQQKCQDGAESDDLEDEIRHR